MHKNKKNLIYLTGFMGSGKSTIAPLLANTLGYDYLDIDTEIQRITGKTISDIFSELGEEYFRQVERQVLYDVSRRNMYVISLGGGTVANQNNVNIIKASGVLVYLKTEPEEIFHRMRFKTDRPLLKTPEGNPLSDEELRVRIQHLITAREPFYSQADVTIVADDRRIGVTVDEIVRHIKHLIE
ncbi:MAG: shikimate kinase [Ignavibacteriae bacterium]|nr:shikimate kinase [Ignavibacteriota bacterium]